jgi:hypothetical protein
MMSPLQAARLAWLKLRRRAVHAVEDAVMPDRLARHGERWAATWRASLGDHGGTLAGWLAREGGGRFWLEPGEAAEWARGSCTPGDIEWADAAAGGVFDLLGAGPVELGAPPEWRRDLYTGREWPLEPSHRLRIARGDGSDIRTVWELSRFYHVVVLARAYRCTGDTRYRDAFVGQVESWIEQNPLGRGPHWASPMDAALRAANWTLGLLLFADDAAIPAAFWERVLANLHATGSWVERHLEWHPVYRGNHYVSNGVGLVYLGALFRGTRDGDRWLRVGARILTEEIQHQVHPDGVAFEASLGYHRLDTEFFAWGGELLRLNLPGGIPAEYERRLRAMYRFMEAYLPPSGEAPMIGDADDGRLHALSAVGFRYPRRHRLGLPDRYRPAERAGAAAFRQGGFYVLRGGDSHAVVRCGAVGLNGAGSHDHNDQLGLELVLGGRRVVADSGTYAYTRDLDARFAFRATAAHSVVQVGGEEQNPIRPDRPWRVLGDRARAECVAWEVRPERQLFVGRHHGFAHRASGAVCVRRVELWPAEGRCRIEDRVEGAGSEEVAWRMHLGAGEARVVAAGADSCNLWLAGDPPVLLRLAWPAWLRLEIGESAGSDRYGERYTRPCITITGAVPLPLTIEATLSLADPSAAPGRPE